MTLPASMRFLLFAVTIIAVHGSLLQPLVAGPRNVILFVTDDQGRDAGCFGNPVIQTPSLDALARDGIQFSHAFCTTASCSASRSVILTGIHNHANGHYGHAHAYHKFGSYPQVKTLPVRLANAGYRTALCGKYHVLPESTYAFSNQDSGERAKCRDDGREFS